MRRSFRFTFKISKSKSDIRILVDHHEIWLVYSDLCSVLHLPYHDKLSFLSQANAFTEEKRLVTSAYFLKDLRLLTGEEVHLRVNTPLIIISKSAALKLIYCADKRYAGSFKKFLKQVILPFCQEYTGRTNVIDVFLLNLDITIFRIRHLIYRKTFYIFV